MPGRKNALAPTGLERLSPRSATGIVLSPVLATPASCCEGMARQVLRHEAMASTPEERLCSVEHELDRLTDADKELLSQYGVGTIVEPISDWYCYRNDPLRYLRCCRRFWWKLERPKEWMMANIFMVYEANECEEGEKIAIWTTGELFRPGHPACANYSVHETVPLEKIVNTGMGAFIRERMIRCQAAIDAAS